MNRQCERFRSSRKLTVRTSSTLLSEAPSCCHQYNPPLEDSLRSHFGQSQTQRFLRDGWRIRSCDPSSKMQRVGDTTQRFQIWPWSSQRTVGRATPPCRIARRCETTSILWRSSKGVEPFVSSLIANWIWTVELTECGNTPQPNRPLENSEAESKWTLSLPRQN